MHKGGKKEQTRKLLKFAVFLKLQRDLMECNCRNDFFFRLILYLATANKRKEYWPGAMRGQSEKNGQKKNTTTREILWKGGAN